MTTTSTRSLAAPLRRHGFVLALAVLSLYLVLRGTGAYPMVFADEWLYSKSARLYPLADSILPSWLYLALFGQTSHCGPGFLGCARVLNVALYMASAPFLYGIARTLYSRGVAQALTVAVLLMPVNTYTGYFMPEAMYFTAFCVLAHAVLTCHRLPPLRYGLLTGALLGAMCTVKVHGLFLLPALVVFMFYLCFTGERQRWLRRFVLMAGAAVVATLAVKTAIGYLLAGPAGTALLGSFYGNHASNTEGGGHLMKLIGPALTSLYGHLLTLTVVLALPLATYLAHLTAPARERNPDLARAQVFAVLMLGAAVGVTVLFTASIANAAPGEGYRLHMRYYNFILPLVILLAVAPLRDAPRRRIAIALVLAAALVAAAVVPLVPTFATSFIDSPELEMLADTKGRLVILASIQLALVACWAWRPQVGLRAFGWVLLPLALLSGQFLASKIMTRQQTASDYDKAGIMVRDYLSKQEAAGVTVAGEGGGLLRALFHIDTAGADFIELTPGAPLRENELPPNRPWLLVVGPHPLPPTIVPEIRTPDYALIRLKPTQGTLARIGMDNPLGSGALTAVDGMASPEPWGAWSVAGQVRLRFAKPLPRSLRLIIKGTAFGPNQDADFVLRVGTQQQPFRLGMREQFRVFDLETDGNTTEVTIDVPKPTAPVSIGQGPDERRLGMALQSVEFGSR
jgi:phosphoglycerol transferase